MYNRKISIPAGNRTSIPRYSIFFPSHYSVWPIPFYKRFSSTHGLETKQNRFRNYFPKTALFWDMTPCRLAHNHRHSEDCVATICKDYAFLFWEFVLTHRSCRGGGNWN